MTTQWKEPSGGSHLISLNPPRSILPSHRLITEGTGSLHEFDEKRHSRIHCKVTLEGANAERRIDEPRNGMESNPKRRRKRTACVVHHQPKDQFSTTPLESDADQ